MKYTVINLSDVAQHPNFSLNPRDYIQEKEDSLCIDEKDKEE